jgi:hypothetical protein
LLIAVTFLEPVPALMQSRQTIQVPSGPPEDNRPHRLVDETPSLSDKQKVSIMRANFEKSKSDAAELAALAKGLREELDKPNVSVLSLGVISRAEKIEKLAKKIRDETKGF